MHQVGDKKVIMKLIVAVDIFANAPKMKSLLKMTVKDLLFRLYRSSWERSFKGGVGGRGLKLIDSYAVHDYYY